MLDSLTQKRGWHFLQIPGPANTPDRVLRAMARPLIDHRGPEFARMTLRILERLKTVFKTTRPVLVFAASGHGAWEAALVNCLSPGDKVLVYENGHFAAKWCKVAAGLGLNVNRVEGDWRRGVDPAVVEATLLEDHRHLIKAVMVVHTETSTGVTSHIASVRNAIDRAKHPALLMVDAVSSLATTEFKHGDWGVDVTVSASQKGLMMSPGLCFNAISDRALEANKTSQFSKGYWDWQSVLTWNERGFFPYTPATTLLFGLDEALAMLLEEGLEQVFARHARLAQAAQQAVRAWGLEMQCLEPSEYAKSITAVRIPDGHDADKLREVIGKRLNMSLGKGLGKVEGKIFRIGHLGDMNELMLLGALSGVEIGMKLAGVPHQPGGVQAALEFLAS